MLLFSLILYYLFTKSFTLLVEGKCASDMYNNASDWILINDTYCLVNECTIKIKESNLLLNITNKTGEWIIAVNTTDLFTISANNGISCNLDNPEVGFFFIFITIVSFVAMTSSCINIALHLVVKQLRTVAGIIVIEICVTVIISGICQVSVALVQHVIPVNENKGICPLVKYAVTASTLLYTIVKATYLFDFASLMYRTHRLRGNSHSHVNKKLLCIYGMVNVIAGVICTALVIGVDLLHEKSAFSTHNGYCTTSFYDLDTSTSNKVLLVIYATVTMAGIIFFIIALIFYYLATKQLWTCKGGPSGIRVSVTLISSVALGALLLVILLLAGVTAERSIIAAGISVLVEQTVLLIVFLTSKKVRVKLKCLNCANEDDTAPLLGE